MYEANQIMGHFLNIDLEPELNVEDNTFVDTGRH